MKKRNPKGPACPAPQPETRFDVKPRPPFVAPDGVTAVTIAPRVAVVVGPP
jgi:hypothetical protein